MKIMDHFVVLTLLFGASTGSHTLQYLTVVSSQNATTTVQLDGETFVSYSSRDTGLIPKTEWIKQVYVDVSDYWKSEKSRMSGDHGDLQHHLSGVEELLHQTKGAPTLTRTYTCEISDDNTTRGSLQILYDGEDFIRLNLSSGTWTAANHQAEQFLNTWEHAERNAKHWTNYLNYTCIKCLQEYLTYSNSVNQGSHTLQYLTVVSSLNATTTVQLDGETVVSYSSRDTGVFPKTKWIKKIDVDVSDYWKSEKSRMSGDHQDLQHHLNRVEELLHQTKGAPTLTRTYTCEISDDHRTRGSLQILYDGEDFIRLNLSSGTWTADNHQAEQFLKVWEHAGDEAERWTHYLNYTCIKLLKQCLNYRVKKGGGSGGGADGGSGGGAGGRAHARKFIIATVLVLVIVFIVALFLSYMREKLNSKTAVSTSVTSCIRRRDFKQVPV